MEVPRLWLRMAKKMDEAMTANPYTDLISELDKVIDLNRIMLVDEELKPQPNHSTKIRAGINGLLDKRLELMAKRDAMTVPAEDTEHQSAPFVD